MNEESRGNSGEKDGAAVEDRTAETMAAQEHPGGTGNPENQEASPDSEDGLKAVLDTLYVKSGHDFRCYKPATLVRRIRRRMAVEKIAAFADYARFLHEHPHEAAFLKKDLLIGVTEFFRQPQAWETLQEKAVAVLVEEARQGSEIRVWVPGCSTGKEAYSLAMLLAEQMEKSGKDVSFQIFATDSDAASLAIARSGIYSEEDLGESVSPERKKRFFIHRDGRRQVIEGIRKGIAFAPQNLTTDPPFSRLDLISCRNLLIYLDQGVQQKIVAMFHFALREGGFLFLGSAETIGDRQDLFKPVSKKWRIYRRIGVGRRMSVEIPVYLPGESQLPAGRPPAAASASRPSLASLAQQMLLDRFAPACVLADRKFKVVYVHGQVENYLTFPSGEMTAQVMEMAREGLRARLRAAIAKCIEVNRLVSFAARVRRGKKSVPVKVSVSPLRHPRETDGLLLITFEDYRIPAAKSLGQASEIGDFRQLEDELKVTREELQSTIEQLENSNDRLKVSNEEVTAANEELQSANEELETSKEELHSLNEELNTINARLQDKVDELESTNNDVVNLLSSTSIATVFLDKELKVRRYTPASTQLLCLIPTDAGRPVAEVRRRFTDGNLHDDAYRVLADLTPISREVRAEDGRWFIRRITPYRTHDDRIEGVVLTLVDVSDLKRTEEVLQTTLQRFYTVLSSLYGGVLLVTEENRVEFANQAFCNLFDLEDSPKGLRRLTSAETIEKIKNAYLHPEEAVARIRDIVGRAQPVKGEEVAIRGGRTYLRDCIPIHVDGKPYGRLWHHLDITARKKAEDALQRLNADLERRVVEKTSEIAGAFDLLNGIIGGTTDKIATMDTGFRFTSFNDAYKDEHKKVFGTDIEVGTSMVETLAHLPEDRKTAMELWGRALGGEAFYVERELGDPGRTRNWYEFYFYPIRDAHGVIVGAAHIGRDVTGRRRAEEALKLERQRLHDVFEMLPVYVVLLTPDYHVPFANRFFRERFGESGGKRCFEYLFGRTEPCEICETYSVLKTGEPHHWAWTGPDGRNYDIFDFPFTDTDGSSLIMEMGIDVTDLKRAEESLREANETLELRVAERTAELAEAQTEAVEQKNRLEAVMEVLPVGVAIVDELGGNIRSNRMFDDVWGAPRPAARDVSDYEAFRAWWVDTGELVQSEEWASARAVQKSETVIGQMLEIESFDGFHKFIMNSAAPVHDASGRIVGSAVTVQDITDLKRAEAAVIESGKLLEREKELLQSVMNGAGNSHLVYLDRDFNFVCVNQVYAASCGYEPEEMVGKNHFALYPHEENESIFRQVRDTGVPAGFHDKPFVFPDQPDRGITYWDWTLNPVKDDAGNVEGLVFSLVETTERKRAAQALRESQTRFKLLSETAGRLLASENPQGIVNELCRRIMVYLDCHVFFNFLVDERAGKLHLNAWAGIPDEKAQKIEWLDYGVAVCGCVAQQACRIVAEDIPNTPDVRTDLVKSYGIQAYACHPLMARGKLIGTLSFGTKTRTSFSPRDLALMKTLTDQVSVAMERIRLIEALQASRDELELRVQERTAELLNANRALAQSNRDLEDFAHVASHDLQEPLRKIQTFSDRLVTGYRESLDDKACDYLERMQRAAERMQALVLDLLMYSRITSKPKPAVRFKLKEAVQEAEMDLLMLREETDGRIEVGELPEIRADRVQMRQLFQNLIGNGLKYHGEEPPVIKVYDRSPSSGAFWEIHVKDNGIGFNESYLNKIFKPFQRLHGRNAPYQGTGMGLAICRRIVERHGGSISARSKPGEGATFIVKLPRGL